MSNRDPIRATRVSWLRSLSLGGALFLAACGADEDKLADSPTPDASSTDTGIAEDSSSGEDTDDPGPTVEEINLDVEIAPPGPPIPRLTMEQLENSLHDVFGDDVVVPPIREPENRSAGFVAVGNGLATISPRGVENLEIAAYEVAAQVLAEDARDRLPCVPAAVDDEACYSTLADHFGSRLWRRPLSEEEIGRLAGYGLQAAEVLGDPIEGAEFTIAGLIQSPHFIFRREIGTPDPARGELRVLDDYELAARLSYLLWNTTPDDELLAAAAAGELSTADGLMAHAERLIDDPRGHEGVLNFFMQLYELEDLEDKRKDPTVFTALDDELFESALQQTRMTLEHMIFEEDGDFRDIMTTDVTFLNRQLASLYGVRAEARDGFALTELPEETRRRGLLGMASILAVTSHPASSSVTLRGLFVRERLLCAEIPAPPADVDTSIPEPSPDARTMRERIAIHLEEPSCANCHLITDPIGLGLENYDGIGRWRDTENEALIDASGDLDGEVFSDGYELAELIRNHDDFHRCVVQSFYRYGTGTLETRDTLRVIDALDYAFIARDYSFRSLVLDFIASPAFRYVGLIEDTEE